MVRGDPGLRIRPIGRSELPRISALLGFAEELARKRGVRKLRVSASLTAVGSYERLGRTVELAKAL